MLLVSVAEATANDRMFAEMDEGFEQYKQQHKNTVKSDRSVLKDFSMFTL